MTLSHVRKDLENKANPLPLIKEDSKELFQAWYCRFLAHFIRIYENSAPPFVHNELLWSKDEANTKKYLLEIEKGSHGMDDLLGILNSNVAFKKLSKKEQTWISENPGWPYS